MYDSRHDFTTVEVNEIDEIRKTEHFKNGLWFFNDLGIMSEFPEAGSKNYKDDNLKDASSRKGKSNLAHWWSGTSLQFIASVYVLQFYYCFKQDVLTDMSVEEVAIPGGDPTWTAHNVSTLISLNGV